MIVPQFWAEARRQHRERGRQVTVRRFGWSDESPEAAQAHAEQRAGEALREILSGAPRARRERRAAYNGADGLPIREEIVGRHGDVVLTRNSYGAVCMNVPDVIFADVDFDESREIEPGILSIGFALLAAIGATLTIRTRPNWLVPLIWGYPMAVILSELVRWARRKTHRDEARSRNRLERFLEDHPDWAVRVYRTPNGLRLLVTHRHFDPTGPEAAEFFLAIGVDRVYARMCERQRCFRARLTAKPWRIGIGDHFRPRPGVWPIRRERMPERLAWLERYDAAAREYAACVFVDSLGSGLVDGRVRSVVELHDRLSGATSGRPIA
jgi:hypothetical protein